MTQAGPHSSRTPRALLFTDLDGCLVTPEDPIGSAAHPAIREALSHGVQIVFVTSKTRAELGKLSIPGIQQSIWIFETGGGIVIPSGSPASPVAPLPAGSYRRLSQTRDGLYIQIAPHICEIQARTSEVMGRFSGARSLYELSDGEIAKLVRLTEGAARRARIREFDIPIHAPDTQSRDSLSQSLAAAGLGGWIGGDFVHANGGPGKEGGLELLIQLLDWAGLPSLAMGDAPGDAPFMKIARFSVIVPNIHISPETMRSLVPNASFAACAGPLGWSEAVMRWLPTAISR